MYLVVQVLYEIVMWKSVALQKSLHASFIC